MQTISIEVSDKNDLQLLLLLVKRLGLKIVKTPAQTAEPGNSGNATNKAAGDTELEYHRRIIETGGVMTEKRMQEMLDWLEEDRQDDSRSSRPS